MQGEALGCHCKTGGSWRFIEGRRCLFLPSCKSWLMHQEDLATFSLVFHNWIVHVPLEEAP